ncbi:sensor domain-containing protein [Mycobacterium sp. 1274756.6]|uniref:sensor domain-containing protein n=1 Tax=Mycobacterium sp. 1274756.6 TaxID=1834076 RepID=UPI00336AC956
MARAQGAPAARSTRRRVLVGSAVVVLALAALVAVVFGRGLPGRSATADDDAENRTVAADDLGELLPGPAEIEPLLPAAGLVVEDLIVPVKGENVVPRECTGAATAGSSTTYSGIPMTGMAAQRLREDTPEPGPPRVLQVATAFRSEKAAGDFRDRQQKAWTRCTGKTVTATAVDGATSTSLIGEVRADGGMLTVDNTDPGRPGWLCRRAMTTRENVVIDVLACGEGVAEDAATAIATRIGDNVQ